MRSNLLRGLLIAALLTLLLPSWASTIVYRFRIVDDSNAPVAGATIVQNTTKSFAAATLGNAVAGLTLTPTDLGNGDYGIAYDPEGSNGEVIVNYTVSKVGSTITGSNASISVVLTKDSSRVLNADAAVSTRLPTSGYTAPANPTDYARNNVSPTWYTAPANPTDYARNNVAPGWYTAPPTDYARNNVAPSWWMLPSTYPLSVNDEATLAGLHAMLTAYDNTAKFTSSALSNAPSASDPFGLTKGTYGAGTWGAYLAGNLPSIVQSYATGQDPGTLVMNAVVDSGGGLTLTFKQAAFLNFVASVGKFGTPVRSSSAPWTITVPFLRLDGSTTGWTYVTTYSDNTFSKATGRSFTAGTLP